MKKSTRTWSLLYSNSTFTPGSWRSENILIERHEPTLRNLRERYNLQVSTCLFDRRKNEERVEFSWGFVPRTWCVCWTFWRFFIIIIFVGAVLLVIERGEGEREKRNEKKNIKKHRQQRLQVYIFSYWCDQTFLSILFDQISRLIRIETAEVVILLVNFFAIGTKLFFMSSFFRHEFSSLRK